MKIISGGQTGVDRAALDIALHLGLPHGGWCPSGRRAEDGTIDPRYALRETASRDYSCRTRWNVRDSDATLVLYRDNLEGGTAYTIVCTEQLQRPCLAINLAGNPDIEPVRQWLDEHKVETLNVAGPRASKHPGIYREAYDFLEMLLRVIRPAMDNST